MNSHAPKHIYINYNDYDAETQYVSLPINHIRGDYAYIKQLSISKKFHNIPQNFFFKVYLTFWNDAQQVQEKVQLYYKGTPYFPIPYEEYTGDELHNKMITLMGDNANITTHYYNHEVNNGTLYRTGNVTTSPNFTVTTTGLDAHNYFTFSFSMDDTLQYNAVNSDGSQSTGGDVGIPTSSNVHLYIEFPRHVYNIIMGVRYTDSPCHYILTYDGSSNFQLNSTRSQMPVNISPNNVLFFTIPDNYTIVGNTIATNPSSSNVICAVETGTAYFGDRVTFKPKNYLYLKEGHFPEYFKITTTNIAGDIIDTASTEFFMEIVVFFKEYTDSVV
jgi:hypothetical protein